MKSQTNIGIVGLGLIGGSLSLDLQKLGYQVFGVSHKEETVVKARQRGLANTISTNPEILKECSIIILALPILQLLKPSQQLIKSLPKNAVITDVGSVKKPILNIWQNLHPNFVPSHPMAGTNEAGVESGKHGLFHGKAWVSTPNADTKPNAIEKIKELAISLGSEWIITDADLHDQAVALISHMPIFVSAALLNTAIKENNKPLIALSRRLASSGFADTTRIGGGNPELGLSMAQANKENILHAVKTYREKLDQIEQHLINQEWSLLKSELKIAKETRSDYI